MTLFPDATWTTFPRGRHNVLLTFTGGLSDSLTDLSDQLQYHVAREACEELVALKWFARKRDPGLASEQYGPYRYTLRDFGSLPETLKKDVIALRSWSIA